MGVYSRKKVTEEVVNEEVTIEVINENNILKEGQITVSINTTENTNFKYDPYFKVYPQSGSKTYGTECARIALLRAEYVDHYNSIKLSAKERKDMIALLKKGNNWEKLCKAITKAIGSKEEKFNYDKREMPDYSKLESRFD